MSKTKARVKLTSYIDTADDLQMRKIESDDGVIRSEQIRRYIKLGIQSRASRARKSEHRSAGTGRHS